MASYAYERVVLPYATSELAEFQINGKTIPKNILMIRVGEAKSLYQDSLRPSDGRSLTPEMEFTFMTNLLYQENRREVVDFLKAEADAHRSKSSEAMQLNLLDLVAFYEDKARISEEAARYLSELF